MSSLVQADAAPVPDAQPEPPVEGRYAIESLRVFVETLDRIRSHYVEARDDETLLEDAIEGMVQRLDPHSSYLTGDAYAALQEATEGVFGGIGVEILEEEGRLKVVAPIDGTPAARAGLRPGDWIEAVDGESTAVVGTEAALAQLRGAIGDPVTLTLRRGGEEAAFDVTLTRALIDIPSVNHRWLVPGLAYLRVVQFQTHTGRSSGRPRNLTGRGPPHGRGARPSKQSGRGFTKRRGRGGRLFRRRPHRGDARARGRGR